MIRLRPSVHCVTVASARGMATARAMMAAIVAAIAWKASDKPTVLKLQRLKHT